MIARCISAEDFENLDSVKGINIQRGVTAHIYIDGRQVAQLSGGTYDFINQHDIDDILAKQARPGLVGFVGKAFKSLLKAITGQKVSDVIGGNTVDYSGLRSMDDVVRLLQPQSDIRVYLKSDYPFNLVFGAEEDFSGKISFAPMKIMCRHLTAEVGLSLQMKIVDFDAFIRAFLVDRKIVTCVDLERYMTPYVRAALVNTLRNVEMDEFGVPAAAVAEIENLIAHNVSVPGVSLTQVREITVNNADFDRLRQVADELYVSEKELELAVRTGEFRNRLANVENSQKIAEARTDFDLYKALAEVNKDRALHDHELDGFYMLLASQKKIREAKNDYELKSALDDIAAMGLLKDDEMEALTTELMVKKTDRNSVAEIMTMQSLAKVEAERIRVETMLDNERYRASKSAMSNAHDLQVDELNNTIDLDNIARIHDRTTKIEDEKHETEVLGIQLGRQGMVDNYTDQRHYIEIEKKKADEEMRLRLEEMQSRQKASNLERLMRINMAQQDHWATLEEKKAQGDHQRKIDEKLVDNSHEQAMAASAIENRRVSATMTPEQLMAEQAAMLTGDAQKALAESGGNARALKVMTEMQAKALEDARFREQQAKQDATRRENDIWSRQREFFGQLSREHDSSLAAMRDMVGMVSGMKDRQAQTREDEINRLDERVRHEQQRNDDTYRTVLSHEESLQRTSVDAIRAASGQAFVPPLCPNCGRPVASCKCNSNNQESK